MLQTPCTQGNPNDWFAYRGSALAARAKRACADCPIMLQCRSYACEKGVPDGIWGGLDGRDRELYWDAHGGRPTAFQDSIDNAIRPMLQARRDAEALAAETFGYRVDPVSA